MADNEYRPHLWIPEGEVDSISKKPTGRSNKYDLSYTDHGNKLSQGLKDIIDLFQRIQASDSLSQEDLIAFKVVLQDKEDFASQKDFIEEEGMRINGVKDKNHAVVTAPRHVFENLQKRVNRYQTKGTKKAFQYIASFEPFRGEDKQSASLLKYFKDNPDLLTVDVQMMVLPDIEKEKQDKIRDRLVEKIQKEKGQIQGEPYDLTDGTPIIRAVMSASSLKSISEDQGIYRIEKTAFFQLIAPSALSPYAQGLQLEPNIDIDKLPAVVVLDDGVNLPDGLSAIAPVHWQATGCTKGVDFGAHGTPVSSRVAFEDLGMHMADTTLVPRAKIIDAQIVDTEKTPGDVMLKRIREAVVTFAPVAKIFNFSYNAETPIEGDEMSFLGCELDLLCRAHKVKFVISAGNHELVFAEDSLTDIIEDDDTRIAEPADAMLGITVGAVVGQTHPGSVSKANDIAPYSRRGPGFSGFYKPDLVAYGATQFKNMAVPPDPFALCLSHTGYCALPGTSFTAPTVAGDLAQVLSQVPDGDVNMAQTLLYNGAVPLIKKEDITQEEIDLAGNLYGRGLSSPLNSMYSSENKVTFIHSGTMNRLTKQHVKFHMPTFLADTKVKRGTDKVRVTVTCIVQPPVDRTRGTEYSAAYIRTSIHRLNANGKNVVDNPSISDNRNEWDTCYHFTKDFSSFNAGDWEIWLELFTRWGIADDEEVPYTLAITLEDLTGAGVLYSEIIRETAGRFRPVQQQRISVR